ncbi:hypothetical protein [Rhodococcus sp. NPDC058514]|uniref:hypothetical protein n=1 Tax=unclassified Rhodococcus (in: high G+C Gram-positive bacteria) TaxID=192944 RepID=UPI00364F49A9
MSIATTRRRRVARIATLPAAALALAGTALGLTGATASAGTLPTTGPTIAMTITNNTGQPMVLRGSDNPYGEWVQGPRAVLAPWSSEIVTATNNDPRGIGVDVTYSLPGDAQAVFMANNYRGDASLDGTRMTGRDGAYYGIAGSMDTGFPNLNAGYTITMHP